MMTQFSFSFYWKKRKFYSIFLCHLKAYFLFCWCRSVTFQWSFVLEKQKSTGWWRGLLNVSFLSCGSLQEGEFGAGSTGDEERHVVIKRLQVWLALHTPGYKNVSPWAQWAAVEFALELLVWFVFLQLPNTYWYTMEKNVGWDVHDFIDFYLIYYLIYLIIFL